MTAVLQPWAQNLSFMMQSVLLASTRAADGLPKNHVSKLLMRWLRRCFLYSAFESQTQGVPVVLARPWTQGGGSFTGPSLDIPDVPENEQAGWRLFDAVVDEYLSSVDAVPHHFHLHLMHAGEIVGYEHSDTVLRDWWHRFYLRCVNDMHLFPEPVSEMRRRLGDSEKDWRAAEEVTAAGPTRLIVAESPCIAAPRAVAMRRDGAGLDVRILSADKFLPDDAAEKLRAEMAAIPADACDVTHCPTPMDRVARREYDVTSTPEHPLTKAGLGHGYYQLCATHHGDLSRNGLIGFLRPSRPITDPKNEVCTVGSVKVYAGEKFEVPFAHVQRSTHPKDGSEGVCCRYPEYPRCAEHQHAGFDSDTGFPK